MPTQTAASNNHSTSLEYFHSVFLEHVHFLGPVILSPGVSEQKDEEVFSCESRADFSLKAAFE